MKVKSWDDFSDLQAGQKMYDFAKLLWPLPRSLSGNGVRETLRLIKERLPELKTFEVPSGTQAFDWTVPKEWNIRDAYIITPDGRRIANFKENNLHVVGYSTPVDRTLSLAELKPHLFSLPNQPQAIPYITSYYREFFGFCISHDEYLNLKEGDYRVFIDADLKPGNISYAELVIPGSSQEEIFISTYVCHPSMANNELSGPVLATQLCQWIQSQPSRHYTYRFFFGPETIGSIIYLSKNIEHLKKHVHAGYVLTCVGDELSYSYMPSRYGNTANDHLTTYVLDQMVGNYKKYSFRQRGSDERQYCSPGVDLPVVSVMRSKYGEYPEYHTSLDNLSFISPAGLAGAFAVMKASIWLHEQSAFGYQAQQPCEAQLGKHGLYPLVSDKNTKSKVQLLTDILAYCDGTNDLMDLARLAESDVFSCLEVIDRLLEKQLIRKVDL